jgi:hypothetical protein
MDTLAGTEPPRCLRCNYVLAGLPEPRCPECGLDFNPSDPTTYTTKPPFIFWRYWLPPILMIAIFCGIWALLFKQSGVGISATLIVPLALGGVIGYGSRGGKLLLGFLAILAAALAMLFLVLSGLQGVFCAIILFGIILIPVLCGLAGGIILRTILKRSSFSQRWHLPILFFLALPLISAWVEGPVSCRYGQINIRTSQVIDAPLAAAWAGVTTYEDVLRPPPLLLRLGLSRPLYSVGSMTHVGDIKTCVYDQGKLVKRITKVEPGKEIAFEVIHQSIERCSAKLIGGSFQFEQISPNQTRVTLTTIYEPFLAPRFAWQPFEELSAHALHQHVLYGMADNALHPQLATHRSERDIPAENSEHDHHAHP